MLKGKLENTLTKDNGTIGCAISVNNMSEDGGHKTNITVRKIVEYFNSLSKHTDYQEKKVMLNENLNDLCIKDLYDIDD